MAADLTEATAEGASIEDVLGGVLGAVPALDIEVASLSAT
jgi:hypothetical protein